MREEPRFKAIVIPKIGNKYVVVKDKKYGEYTFVIGGCKLNEPSTACALRELAEETRNAVSINASLMQKPSFTFESRDRSPSELRNDKRKGVVVTMWYNVFVVPLEASFEQIERNYHAHKFTNNKAYAETSGIYLMTLSELMKSEKTWRMMKDNVLPKLMNRANNTRPVVTPWRRANTVPPKRSANAPKKSRANTPGRW